MEIRINNHGIDYKLQNEKKISDIADFILSWTSERELVIFRIEVDGIHYSIDNIPDVPLENVGLINFVIQSKADIVFTTVEEGVRYCDKACKFIEKLKPDEFAMSELKNLSDGLQWLESVIFSVLNILGIERRMFSYKGNPLEYYIREMDDYQDELLAFEDKERALKWLGKNSGIFLTIKDILRALLTCDEMKGLIMHSVDSPDLIISTLKALKEALPAEVQNIEDIAVAFQSGKDKDGAEKIQRFVDFIFSFSRVCHHIEPVFGINTADLILDGVSLFDKNREIHDLLNETIEVMENQDYISLADVLEYEMKPTVEAIKAYIDLMIQKTESM